MGTDAGALAQLIAAWHGIELPPVRVTALARMLDDLTLITGNGGPAHPTKVASINFDQVLVNFPDTPISR